MIQFSSKYMYIEDIHNYYIIIYEKISSYFSKISF